MKLFLARLTLRHSIYMDDRPDREEEVLRLVWATDDREARAKVDAVFEKPDPYGHSVHVYAAEFSEAL